MFEYQRVAPSTSSAKRLGPNPGCGTMAPEAGPAAASASTRKRAVSTSDRMGFLLTGVDDVIRCTAGRRSRSAAAVAGSAAALSA